MCASQNVCILLFSDVKSGSSLENMVVCQFVCIEFLFLHAWTDHIVLFNSFTADGPIHFRRFRLDSYQHWICRFTVTISFLTF